MKKTISILVVILAMLMFTTIVVAQSISDITGMASKYDSVIASTDKYLVVHTQTTYSIVEASTGKEVYNSDKRISHLVDNYFLQKDSIIDPYGNIIFTTTLGSIRGFTSDKVTIYKDGKYHLIDLQGNIILSNCDSIVSGNKAACYSRNNVWCFYADNGTSAVLPYDYIYASTNPNYFFVSQNDRWGIINANGTVCYPNIYTVIDDIENNQFLCYKEDGIDIIDSEMNLVYSCDIGYAGRCNDNIIVSNDGKNTFYYNLVKGQKITLQFPGTPIFHGDFSDGYAGIVFPDGNCTYINTNGQLATDQVWDKISNFHNGYALVAKKITKDTVKTYEWRIINRNFSSVVRFIDEPVVESDAPYFKIDGSIIKTYDRKNDMYGYIYINHDLYTNPTESFYANTYDINFISNNELYKSITGIVKSGKILIPDCSQSNPGYTFSHWTDGTTNYKPGDTYIMPAHNVTMTAIWTKNSTPTQTPTDPWWWNNGIIPTYNPSKPTVEDPPKYVCPFTDITEHWAYAAICLIDERDLIDGITDTLFHPDAPMTREVFVTALAKLAGCKENYVDWAIDNGLLTGYGNGDYGLNDTITREQMAVFFMRFFEIIDLDLTKFQTVEPYRFADDSIISEWAYTAVYDIQELGLIQGKGENMYDPRGTATRAEVSAVLSKLITNILSKLD